MSDFKAEMHQIQFRLKREEGTPKGCFTPYVRNPEKFPDCITDLIGGAATQTFAPGAKHPRVTTGWSWLLQLSSIGQKYSRGSGFRHALSICKMKSGFYAPSSRANPQLLNLSKEC